MFGESWLDGTAAGTAALAAPLLLGGLLVLWSFLTPRAPSRRTTTITTGVCSAALLGLGLWSAFSAESGDASIGGGLLVLTSIALGVFTLFTSRTRRR